jgi:hypothetical protein
MIPVEFNTNPSTSAIRSASLRGMWLSKVLVCYFAIVGVALIAGLITSYFVGDEDHWAGFWLIILVLLLAPFAYIRGIVDRQIRTYAPTIHHYRCTAEGLLAKTDDASVELKWHLFSQIDETSQYIFLRMLSGTRIILHKTKINGCSINELKNALKSTGISRQHWKS